MRYLIDGYNLLHALLGPPATPHGLESARHRLLDRLCELPRLEPPALIVVFDALNSPNGLPSRDRYRGIALHFSRQQTADDHIEELLRTEPQPKTLTVVSDDLRVQTAARRRTCLFLGCLDWVEAMKRPAPVERKAEAAEKPESVGEAEQWLRAFGSADRDQDDLRPLR